MHILISSILINENRQCCDFNLYKYMFVKYNEITLNYSTASYNDNL